MYDGGCRAGVGGGVLLILLAVFFFVRRRHPRVRVRAAAYAPAHVTDGDDPLMELETMELSCESHCPWQPQQSQQLV